MYAERTTNQNYSEFFEDRSAEQLKVNEQLNEQVNENEERSFYTKYVK